LLTSRGISVRIGRVLPNLVDFSRSRIFFIGEATGRTGGILEGRGAKKATKNPRPSRGEKRRGLIRVRRRKGLALADRAERASARASTAVDASVCIDLILAVAFGDRANGAFARARTAANASVADYVCHNILYLPYRFCTYFTTMGAKINTKSGLLFANFFR